MEKRSVNIRMSEQTITELDYLLSFTSGQSKSDVVGNLIHEEYDKLHGNPELQRIMEEFKRLQESLTINSMTNKSGGE